METRNGRPGLAKWMLAALILCVPLVSAAQVGISITIAPPTISALCAEAMTGTVGSVAS